MATASSLSLAPFLFFSSLLWNFNAARDTIKLGDTLNSSSSSVSAMDSGNFVLQDWRNGGSTQRFLWQSFDFPVDTLLPASGAFTLDWDLNQQELKIRRHGVVYWSTGAFMNGRFKFMLPDETKLRYNFSIVSNEDEDSFTYNPVDQSGKSEFVLTIMGRLYDFDRKIDIAEADYCYGSNTDAGCQTWDQPTVGMMTRCRFWTGNWEFVQDRSGSSSASIYFLTTMELRSHKHKRIIWICTATAAASLLIVVLLRHVLSINKKKSFTSRAKVDQKELLDVKKSFTCNDVNGLQEDGEMEHDLRVFIYASLMAATGDFSEENKLGEGGFGPVYKGKLMTGREVAVKRLSRCSVKGLEGNFSTKSDVYSFGVLVLEIISGRKNNSFYNAGHIGHVVEYAWELWKGGAGLRLVDLTLGDSCIDDQLLRCIHVSLLCVEANAADRPSMSEVISMLANESMPLPTPTRPSFFGGTQEDENLKEHHFSLQFVPLEERISDHISPNLLEASTMDKKKKEEHKMPLHPIESGSWTIL
ncbi:unnamed protein product [Prunus armeniaca]